MKIREVSKEDFFMMKLKHRFHHDIATGDHEQDGDHGSWEKNSPMPFYTTVGAQYKGYQVYPEHFNVDMYCVDYGVKKQANFETYGFTSVEHVMEFMFTYNGKLYFQPYDDIFWIFVAEYSDEFHQEVPTLRQDC